MTRKWKTEYFVELPHDCDSKFLFYAACCQLGKESGVGNSIEEYDKTDAGSARREDS